MKHRKAYRFRLYPNATQLERFVQFAGASRFVFNWGLARRSEHYQVTGKGLPNKVLSSELTALKKQPDTAWLKDMHSQALQQALRDLDRAFDNFFAGRSRYPRFKSRKSSPLSFRMPQGVKVDGSKVFVPKVGWVKARGVRPIDGITKSATFKQNAAGHWYVTIVSEFDMPDITPPPANPDHTVGVDMGLKDLAVTSDGQRVAPTRYYRKTQRKLRKAQKAFTRKQKGSNNRAKARRKVARIHERVKNQRQDFLHKLTTQLVLEHDAVCIENLSVKGMARTKLAKSVLDAALGEFRRQLEYKAAWYRKHVAVIDRWYPSSKLHMTCGAINTELKLSDRTWVCACGEIIDRDMNAAQNIKAEGLRMLEAAGHADSLNACRVDVRLTSLAVDNEARIPPL